MIIFNFIFNPNFMIPLLVRQDDFLLYSRNLELNPIYSLEIV